MIDQKFLPTLVDIFPIPTPFHGCVIAIDVVLSVLIINIYRQQVSGLANWPRQRSLLSRNRELLVMRRRRVLVNAMEATVVFVLIYQPVAAMLYAFCGGLFR